MAMLSIFAAAALAVQPAPVGPAPGLASIDFVGGGGIRDWHAEDDRGIYLRDRANRWFYAGFRHRCPGVLTNPTIAFETNGSDRFDRLSLVVTEVGTCAVEGVDPSAAPAAKGGLAASR